MTTSAQRETSLATLDSLLAEIKGLLPTDEQLLGLYSFMQGLPADLHRQAARKVLLGACKSLCPRLAGTAAMFLGEGESEELMLEPELLIAMRDSLYLASVSTDCDPEIQPEFVRMVRRGSDVHGMPFERDCLEALLRLIRPAATVITPTGSSVAWLDMQVRMPNLLNVFRDTVSRDQFRDELVGDAVLLRVRPSDHEKIIECQRTLLQYVVDNLYFNRERCREHLHELRNNSELSALARKLQPEPDDSYFTILTQGMLPCDEDKLLKYLSDNPVEVLSCLLRIGQDAFHKAITESLLRVVLTGPWMRCIHGIDDPEYQHVRFMLDRFCQLITRDPFMAGRLARIKEFSGESLEDDKFSVSFLLSNASLATAGVIFELPRLTHPGFLSSLADVLLLPDPHGLFADSRASHMAKLKAAIHDDCLVGYQIMAPKLSWPGAETITDHEMRQRVVVTRWLQVTAHYQFGVPDDLEKAMNQPGTRLLDYISPRELLAKEAPEELILEICRFDRRLFAPAIDLKLLPESYICEATDEGATLLMSQTLEV
ncbi:hypothetical protein HNP46_000497 [Pseudomonas nitritireducens]|uniref:Uncharacterized protein n=1 Tax=Pseudomonas nitroreducens TaxID=46680 RepID=A0A7W7KF29_PSENT|nr:hypothetical protein [Pseudomonas nitritireducens]MBB4861686.1 hypothetical protein [Pseudomonas nitritireducens]